MKNIKGFDELLKNAKSKTLPDSGWIYVDKKFNLNATIDFFNGFYWMPENRNESFEMEKNDNIKTLLELPTLSDIIDNKLEHHPNSSNDELLEAIIYYLEEDDFLD